MDADISDLAAFPSRRRFVDDNGVESVVDEDIVHSGFLPKPTEADPSLQRMSGCSSFRSAVVGGFNGTWDEPDLGTSPGDGKSPKMSHLAAIPPPPQSSRWVTASLSTAALRKKQAAAEPGSEEEEEEWHAPSRQASPQDYYSLCTASAQVPTWPLSLSFMSG